MKKIIYVCLTLLLPIFSSCDSMLDKKPLDSFTNSNYWTSEANVKAYANSFYSQLTGYANGTDAFYWSTLNDNQANTAFKQWNYTSVPASNSTWNDAYTEIRRANFMIEQIPGIESMSESAKNNWIGLARLYRGWQHYKLVRTFGDCVFVDKTLNISDEDKEMYLYAARQDRDAVMDKVLEDLNFAVANISQNSSSRTDFNNAVAQALKAEICLYEGTFCKYRSSGDGQKAADPARATSWLGEAKKACEAIMNNPMYELSETYQEIYNSEDLANNKEMIMYKKYLYGTMAHSILAYTSSSTMQSGMSKDAFDSYLFIDGKPLATTSEDKTDHPVVKEDGLSIEHMLSVRDKRLSQSVDAYLMYRGNARNRFGAGQATSSSTGYGVYKFDSKEYNDKYGATRRNTEGQGDTDAPIFWLAEIYLTYAEACAELGSCTQDDLNKSVNKLRARAGLPNMTVSPESDPANNHGVSNLIWEIRRERRVELMYDKNDRYWCLIRWHQLDKLDTQKYPNIIKGAYVGEANKAEATIFDDGYIDASNGGSRTYNAKYYLAPIPSGQLDLNPNLGQNYGWTE